MVDMFPPQEVSDAVHVAATPMSKEAAVDRDERDRKSTPEDAQPEKEGPVDGPGKSDDDSQADQGETSQGGPG
jgi:hypothetical protein